MPKDTKSSGNNKAPACESRGFGHKKEGENFDTPSCFFGVYFMRFPGVGAVALVVQTCLRGFPAFFLSLPPIKQYLENYEIFRHECMLRLKN